MGDCYRHRKRPKKNSCADSFSSDSNSDDDSCYPKKKRRLAYLSRCGPLRASINRTLCLFQGYFASLDPRNWTGLGVLVAAIALLGPLAYLILPDTFFKSTSTIVREAIAKYDADRLGRADYALETAGGSVLCSSNTYYSKSGALYSFIGVPLWYHSSSPRMVIQPEVKPGTCWAMDTNQGYVTVQLAMPVIMSAVSLEHIPKALSPVGRLDSAPKEIAIMGQEATVDSPEVFLGKFTYDVEQDPIQVFDIKDPYCSASAHENGKCGPNTRPFNVVTLKVLSNHGNPEYTCIYRFRVHGRPFFVQQ
ncbi:hypothetical protein EGW08_018826 [Elysia chlorotica]|uniref:SUN domain-containing protein n=1 Tax=Elysia chlorotica TaxID=188477 RepID=A0A3S1B2H2_ELYCH|nr:hypothetical protein EGW08_018826 [Elysia chlorotica]